MTEPFASFQELKRYVKNITNKDVSTLRIINNKEQVVHLLRSGSYGTKLCPREFVDSTTYKILNSLKDSSGFENKRKLSEIINAIIGREGQVLIVEQRANKAPYDLIEGVDKCVNSNSREQGFLDKLLGEVEPYGKISVERDIGIVAEFVAELSKDRDQSRILDHEILRFRDGLIDCPKMISQAVIDSNSEVLQKLEQDFIEALDKRLRDMEVKDSAVNYFSLSKSGSTSR